MTVRPNVEEYRFADGRRAYLLAEGRLVNLAAGQGHPVEIMDLSFALQALSAEHLAKHGRTMENRVYAVPTELDRGVAEAALGPPWGGAGHAYRRADTLSGPVGRGDMSESKVPEGLRYAKSHEWVRVDGETVTVGITDHAQAQLTDIVFADLPAAGKAAKAGTPVMVLESVKTVADIYAPGRRERHRRATPS